MSPSVGSVASMAVRRASLSLTAASTAEKFAFTSSASATVPLTKVYGTEIVAAYDTAATPSTAATSAIRSLGLDPARASSPRSCPAGRPSSSASLAFSRSISA